MAILLSQPLFAKTPFTVAPLQGELEQCAKEAGRLFQEYLEIVDIRRGMDSFQVEDFKNTTPGTYNQEYESRVTLYSTREEEIGEDKYKTLITFTGDFECSNLRILKVDLLGTDTNNPLYQCLNDKNVVRPLYDARDKILKAITDLHGRLCDHIKDIGPRSQCITDANASSEGRKLFADAKVAYADLDAAFKDCRDQFLK